MSLPKAASNNHVGALIIRIRFWGPLYYNYNKEPPKQYRQLLRPLEQSTGSQTGAQTLTARPGKARSSGLRFSPLCDANPNPQKV